MYQTGGLKVRQCLYKKTQQRYSDLELPPYCMPTLMRKLLTGIIGEKRYLHLERNGLLTNEKDHEEQKICLLKRRF